MAKLVPDYLSKFLADAVLGRWPTSPPALEPVVLVGEHLLGIRSPGVEFGLSLLTRGIVIREDQPPGVLADIDPPRISHITRAVAGLIGLLEYVQLGGVHRLTDHPAVAFDRGDDTGIVRGSEVKIVIVIEPTVENDGHILEVSTGCN